MKISEFFEKIDKIKSELSDGAWGPLNSLIKVADDSKGTVWFGEYPIKDVRFNVAKHGVEIICEEVRHIPITEKEKSFLNSQMDPVRVTAS